MKLACPCCGREVSGMPDVAEMAAAAKLSPSETLILETLAAARGRYVSFDGIADVLYGADPCGGPDDYKRNIRVLVHRLRRKLAGAKIAAGHSVVSIVADLSVKGRGAIGGGQGYRAEGVRP